MSTSVGVEMGGLGKSWICVNPSTSAKAPDQVVINHGQPAASDALRIHLRDPLGSGAEVAGLGSCYRV